MHDSTQNDCNERTGKRYPMNQKFVKTRDELISGLVDKGISDRTYGQDLIDWLVKVHV